MDELTKAKPKILIVEDDSFSQAILSMFLSKDYDTLVVENGVEAIALLQNTVPQLIISDFNTPEMDGFALLQYLKNDPVYQLIPFVVLCGEDDDEKRMQCLQAGAIEFIVKPFNPVELSALLKGILV